MIDLPAFGGFGKPRDCNYNGTGHWSIDGSGGDITLTLDIEEVSPALKGNLSPCGKDALSLFVLLGHSAPYHFWYYIDDPDEWRGLT